MHLQYQKKHGREGPRSRYPTSAQNWVSIQHASEIIHATALCCFPRKMNLGNKMRTKYSMAKRCRLTRAGHWKSLAKFTLRSQIPTSMQRLLDAAQRESAEPNKVYSLVLRRRNSPLYRDVLSSSHVGQEDNHMTRSFKKRKEARFFSFFRFSNFHLWL